MIFKYMLDTDTVSYAFRGFGAVSEHLLQHKPSEICMSAITLAELRYGADRRGSPKLHGLITAFASAIAVVPFDEAAAGCFGSIASTLAREGTPIGNFDVLIASHALALNVTLVTNNLKHHGRVQGLRIETWV